MYNRPGVRVRGQWLPHYDFQAVRVAIIARFGSRPCLTVGWPCFLFLFCFAVEEGCFLCALFWTLL